MTIEARASVTWTPGPSDEVLRLSKPSEIPLPIRDTTP
jgi:hypothetical protein